MPSSATQGKKKKKTNKQTKRPSIKQEDHHSSPLHSRSLPAKDKRAP